MRSPSSSTSIGDGLEAGRGELRAAGPARGILDGDPAPAAGDERAPEQRHPLRHPGGRRSRARGRRRRRARGPGRRRARCAARAPRAGRRSRAERRGPSAARAAARRARRRAGRARRPGRRDGSRSAARARPRARAAPARRARRPARRAWRRPARDEIALGNELRVGLDDHPARDAELAREPSARGQGAVRREPLVAHRGAQLLLDLGLQRRAAAVQRDEELEAQGNWYMARSDQLVLSLRPVRSYGDERA